MVDSKKIVLLHGDGIGPEIVSEACKVLSILNDHSSSTGVSLVFENHLIGGAAIDATGDPLPDKTLVACKNADAILLGAVGGPKWTNPRPEQGLLKIRKELNLYANIRPCFFPANSLLEHSPLKSDIVKGVKFTVVRELTGGIYFGDRTEETNGIAHDVMTYSVAEVQRITRVAANISLLHDPPLPITSIDKANVLATSRLWRRVVTETLQKEFPTIPFQHQLVDSAAMLMVMSPRKLNGIVLTENMFGDILSDESSVIPGSLGLLPSASLNGWGANSLGIYEPIHGSAPDIAGQGIANPIGTILSAAMLLECSLGMKREARAIEEAVAEVLDTQNMRTKDLGGNHKTTEVGDAVSKLFKQKLSKLYA
ncbi:Isopropylmalate dehydrogenase-like domain-containing protein [Globomyces pollinis-pini]|nr:Isopropylmalate dehydrogenase-like domain-containing protein [Globomyces pollinis-pini]KAJ2991858.1 3-isopropylmalate dehydrogenase [Globomyces sp. JEL0801]